MIIASPNPRALPSIDFHLVHYHYGRQCLCCDFAKWIYGRHAVEPAPSLRVESGHMRLLASQEEKGVAVDNAIKHT